MKIREALAGGGIEMREARLLLAAAAGFSEAAVLAHPERELPEGVARRFQDMALRRSQGEPVAYILGRKEFYGLELAVSPAVLIPRPETELLVELALARDPASLLELGTGSGAVALVLKRRLPRARVVATDACLAALCVAQRNAGRHNLQVEFRHGDWFEPVGGERFEVIVCNPPYVAAGDPHLAELKYEPGRALVSGGDGLEAIRALVPRAPAHLALGGWIFLEHGIGQDAEVRALLSGAGLESVASWPDLAGIARASGGRLKSD